MPKYHYLYGFQCEGSVVFCTLPQIFTHATRIDAVEKAGIAEFKLVLLPDSFVLCDKASGKVLFRYTDEPEQRRLLKILVMTEECAKRMGKPLGPEDITDLTKKGELLNVIFSTAYITDIEKDYREVDWSIADLHVWLSGLTKPDSIVDGQAGFSFESSSFGVIETIG
ncbi:MAG TPA: hypothetical protein PK004_11120 [Smithella sp.]|nr:hypothetical protein [Smithella sp.]